MDVIKAFIQRQRTPRYSELDLYVLVILAFIVGGIFFTYLNEQPCREYCVYSELKFDPKMELTKDGYNLKGINEMVNDDV